MGCYCIGDGSPDTPGAAWIAERPKLGQAWGSGPPKPGPENMGLNGTSEVSGFSSGLLAAVDLSLLLEASVFS